MSHSRKRFIPQNGTLAKKVALALFEHEKPVTLEQGIALHGDSGLPSKYPMQGVYDDMVADGHLIRAGDVYVLAERVRKHYCSLNGKEFNPAPVVQKRTALHKREMPIQVPDERLRKDFFLKTLGGQS